MIRKLAEWVASRFNNEPPKLNLAQAKFIEQCLAAPANPRAEAEAAFDTLPPADALRVVTELHYRRASAKRAAMTLIELLVVIAVILILIVASTVTLNSTLPDRELREAARQVNAHIAGALARSAEQNTAYGIWLDRRQVNPNAILELFYAKVPPLYAGDFLSSRCNVAATAVTFNQVQNFYGPDGLNGTEDDFIRAGDTVRFNYMGPWYPLTSVTGPAAATYACGDRPPPPLVADTPFQIRRSPRKTGGALQMPGNTCVDLSRSGWGAEGLQLAGTTMPVVIMISRTGLDCVYNDRSGIWRAEPMVDEVHLLVGRADQIGPANVADTTSRWVTINLVGGVGTAENIGMSEDHNLDGSLTIADARKFAGR